MRPIPSFDSLEEEVRFLRGLIAVQRMADEVLEDCLERRLGLTAAADVFLTQCARMIHAKAAFVQLTGSAGVVLTRTWGSNRLDVTKLAQQPGATRLAEHKATCFVAPLNLGALSLGAIGFLLPGEFDGRDTPVAALVEAIAEMFDSAVLSFVALSDGQSPLEKLDELQAAGELAPHSRVGKYELVQPLGSGGMAQVMVAKSVNPEGVSRLVALKRILPQLANDEVMVQQFLDEARLGVKLAHPNLVTIYDFGQAAGTYFIAMELIRGVDFDELIYAPHGLLPPEFISAVVCQTLDGLHAAHELNADDGQPLGLVHRDLSPHNVMVGFDGRVKVLDFGVAKMRDQRTVTLPGIVKGKPLYMSPEQACAERIDRRSDLFAVGLILYEALTGRRAFQRDDDTATMQAIVNESLPRPADLSVEYWDVIGRALNKNVDVRYRDAAEMCAALKEIIPPMGVEEAGRLVAQRFPRRLADVAAWEQTKNRPSAKR